jgi:branched-chain amino acid transport system substrate-binding protein
METTRRSFLHYALTGAVAAGTASLTIARDLYAQPGGDIVIGHQTDLTGGNSSWGYWTERAADVAVQEINKMGGIAGRKIRYVVEDSESDATVGARKLRRLIQREQADFIIGAPHSGVNIASTPVAKELKTVYFAHGMADEITGERGNRYVFRCNSDTYSQAAAGCEWAVKNLGKKWTFIFADYAWGWSHYKEHTALLPKYGATAIAHIPVPQNATDFIPYLTKVPPETEELYSMFFGPASVAYYTQSKELGLDKKMNRYSVICAHEAINPKDLGGASEGIYMLEYLPRQLKYKDTPHLRKIRQLLKVDEVDGREQGSNRTLLSSHYWAAWESVWFLKEAVEKSGYKTKKDTPGVIKALEGVRVEESYAHPQGAKTIRAQDHKATIDFWMSRIEKGVFEVKWKIPQADLVKQFPPRVDFTKEPI